HAVRAVGGWTPCVMGSRQSPRPVADSARVQIADVEVDEAALPQQETSGAVGIEARSDVSVLVVRIARIGGRGGTKDPDDGVSRVWISASLGNASRKEFLVTDVASAVAIAHDIRTGGKL